MSAQRLHWAQSASAAAQPAGAAAKPELPASVEEPERKPRVLRVVRVHPGEQVMQAMHVRGVVTQLDLVARYLDGMLADGDAPNELDYLFQSRTFKEGFAARAARDREMRIAILLSLAERPDDGRYAPLAIDGYPPERVAAVIVELWRAGYIDAQIPKIHRVTPGGITRKGLLALKRLGQQKPRKGGA